MEFDLDKATLRPAADDDEARTVKERLVAAGIDGSRLTTAGYGATRPLAKDGDPDAAARNRRVELVRH
ncbi:OmpA family protein [Altererythrobacter halimionae]|uniref:OmpA family protein n=1 Tax=Alteriqipengyuania halimionae TaxID=1926630 RepID=A0A6I4U3R6_9SPHN|nr:OmpA family protein [Alteriqipengyuania halimionae]